MTLRCRLFGHKDYEFGDSMGMAHPDYTTPFHLHCTRWRCGEPLYENCSCGLCRIAGTGKFAPTNQPRED